MMRLEQTIALDRLPVSDPLSKAPIGLAFCLRHFRNVNPGDGQHQTPRPA